MVLGRNRCQRVGLVAVTLEVGAGDVAENACKTGGSVAVFRKIGRLQQVASDLRPRCRRHLFHADDEHMPRPARLDGLYTLLNGGGPGGAGVFHPRCRFEAESHRRPERQGWP